MPCVGRANGRGQIDHRLARQHLINEYRRGRLSQDQVCDAHPELIRAAKNVGTESTTPCPICDEDQLRLVTYVFGPRLPAHGKCVTTAKELDALEPAAGGAVGLRRRGVRRRATGTTSAACSRSAAADRRLRPRRRARAGSGCSTRSTSARPRRA